MPRSRLAQRLTRLLLSFSISYNIFGNASAQSLILGIPNAEIVEQGVMEITHESQIGVSQGASWNSFNILTYGLNKQTELTGNFINLDESPVDGTTLALGAKQVRLLSSNAQEWKCTYGTNIGFAPRLGYRPWGIFSYNHLSMRLPVLKTRLTGGLSYGTSHFFGFKKPMPGTDVPRGAGYYLFSALAGIEHPINEKWTLIADWFSGNQAQGALIGGVQYSPPGMALIVAYKHPNGEASKRALVLEAVFDIMLKRHQHVHTQHGSR
jgi:hypothetical protein